MKSNTILYVQDQEVATRFYSNVLQMEPKLNVPGMTEFQISANHVLEVMPEAWIKCLLGDAIPDSGQGRGTPRAEIYLTVSDPKIYHSRALDCGAKELSPLQKRNWGDWAAYSLDLDSHILVFASNQ